MNRKRALQLVLELAAGNSLTPREAGHDDDLIAQMAEQNIALLWVAVIIDETSEDTP